MSDSEIVLLGAIAGFTIFLGLPIGRIENPMPAFRAFLNAVAVGILIFLLWDVLSAGIEPVETSLTSATNDGGSWWRFIGYSTLLTVCVTVGLVTLVHYDRWLRHSTAPRRGTRRRIGDELAAARGSDRPAQRTETSRAVHRARHRLPQLLGRARHRAVCRVRRDQPRALLIVGFGLHNATEGFGIVAPIAAEGERPSWAFLGLMGLIGGGPTFVGTIVGQAWVDEWLFIAFLGLAAGSILYVVIELLGVGRKLGFKELATWGILLGLFFGFATDMVLVAAGT